MVVNQVIGTTFTPIGPGRADAAKLKAHGVLSGTEALQAFERTDSEFIPPNSITYQLGYVTQPVGDGTYLAKDLPVWALTWRGCLSPMGDSTADPTKCTEWLFLGAYDGKMFDAQSQFDQPGG